MLIAGTTGSGKSVCINSLLISMLYKSTPEELRLIMVDPKMVELGIYNGIPHLLIPVVTDPKKAAGALQWAVTEMMKRYRLFAEAGVRELSSYNHWAEGQEGVDPLPKVVIVIDELADLMLVAAKEVEESICRVAQMGRAAGMHLVIATQRPSADVITGLMKANIPSRIAFCRGLLPGVPDHPGQHRGGETGGQGGHALVPPGFRQASAGAGVLHLRRGGGRRGGQRQGKRHPRVRRRGHGPDRAARRRDRKEGQAQRRGPPPAPSPPGTGEGGPGANYFPSPGWM